LAREWAMRSCVSIPAVLGGCLNLTRQAKSRHARLPKTHTRSSAIASRI
jgi:hypothetical protein